jgi:hypothetical protein
MRHAWQEKYLHSLVGEPGGRRSLRSPSRRQQKNITPSFTERDRGEWTGFVWPKMEISGGPS